MRFTLKQVRELVDLSTDDIHTGDVWLENRYREDIPMIGHTNPYYKMFWLIARIFRPKLSVELGSWRATAAAHLAAGNPNGTVLTIDIHREDKVAQIKAQEADDQYLNLHYINAWTRDAVPVVKAWNIPIDFLYIDAWHRYDDAMEEWRLYASLLADSALVCCDDIFDQKDATVEMVRFWEEVSAPYSRFLLASENLHKWVPQGYFKFERSKSEKR